MKIFKKSQGAIEFIVILVFVLVIIAGIMGVTSLITIDLKNKENVAEVDDFAKSITSEFDLMNKVESGYSRNITIQSHLAKKFRPIINSSYLILVNMETDNNLNKTYYYPLPENSNYTLTNDSNGNYYLFIQKISIEKFEGIILINN